MIKMSIAELASELRRVLVGHEIVWALPHRADALNVDADTFGDSVKAGTTTDRAQGRRIQAFDGRQGERRWRRIDLRRAVYVTVVDGDLVFHCDGSRIRRQ